MHLLSPRVGCTRAAAPLRDGQKQQAQSSYPVHFSSGRQAGASTRGGVAPATVRRSPSTRPLPATDRGPPTRWPGSNAKRTRIPQDTENIGILRVTLASHFSVLNTYDREMPRGFSQSFFAVTPSGNVVRWVTIPKTNRIHKERSLFHICGSTGSICAKPLEDFAVGNTRSTLPCCSDLLRPGRLAAEQGGEVSAHFCAALLALAKRGLSGVFLFPACAGGRTSTSRTGPGAAGRPVVTLPKGAGAGALSLLKADICNYFLATTQSFLGLDHALGLCKVEDVRSQPVDRDAGYATNDQSGHVPNHAAIINCLLQKRDLIESCGMVYLRAQ